MSKITKNQRIDKLVACLRTQGRKMRELEARLSTQEKWSDYADDMLTELNHALPDPEYDAKCEAAVAGVEASLDRHRERLGLNKPQLKQLDQSVFNGLDEKWRFAAVDKGGAVWVYSGKPDRDCGYWFVKEPVGMSIGKGYDASNWQNSLIERDTAKELLEVDLSSELTGSDLARAMLARGDKYVMCRVNDDNNIQVISGWTCYGFTSATNKYCLFKTPIPINNQGEPLTASEVGL